MLRHAAPLLAFALLAAPVARATVVVDRTVAEQARASALVVRGKVVAQEVAWDEAHRQIVTKTILAPTETLKGAARGRVTVRQVGGELDGQRLAIEGSAKFQVGEDVVVFLEPHPDAKNEWVLGSMAAAKFTVVPTGKGLTLQRSLSGLTLARRDAQGVYRPVEQLAPAEGSGIPWDTFVREVRAASAPELRPPAPATTR